MTDPYKLPRPADTTIAMVLQEFLNEQRARLKPKSMGRYESVIQLFQDSLNGYAYQTLSEADSALWRQFFEAKGEGHRDFCQVFGPERIPENTSEFLNYFMVRKVMCGRELKQAAGRVIRKLGQWLVEKGYLAAEDAADMIGRARRAARELPATEDLSQMLAAYVGGNDPTCDQAVEDHFTVAKVEPGKLHLSPMMGRQLLVVPVPQAISQACQAGWTISGAVGQVGKGWRLLEVWNVYP